MLDLLLKNKPDNLNALENATIKCTKKKKIRIGNVKMTLEDDHAHAKIEIKKIFESYFITIFFQKKYFYLLWHVNM